MRKTEALSKLDSIGQAIFDKKGFNILALDVRGISSLSDYVVIAEGNIDRHLKALSLAIKESLETKGERPLFVEGEQSGDWVVIDYGDITIHLFVEEMREKYALETLWRKAKIIDLTIKTK